MPGRPALPRLAYRALVASLYIRAQGRCVYCGGRAHDPDHVVRRSQGGADTDNLVPLCRLCHQRRDAPYTVGRLMVTARAGHGFRLWTEYPDCCTGWRLWGDPT